MARTKISWTEYSWNPVVGCSKVSTGCENCYAERMACRLANMGQTKYKAVVGYTPFKYPKNWNGQVFCDEKALDKPLHWKKPRDIFVCSMGDLFHKDVTDAFIGDVFDVIRKTNWHIYQILTKRPERMVKVSEAQQLHGTEYLSHIHWGTTCENQEMADLRIPPLLKTPAAYRFLSVEPLLGRIKFPRWLLKHPYDMADGVDSDKLKIHQVIIGCESKGQYVGRLGEFKDEADWIAGAIEIAEQCKAAGVAVHIKHIPINGKIVKDITKFPKQLRYRES